MRQIHHHNGMADDLWIDEGIFVFRPFLIREVSRKHAFVQADLIGGQADTCPQLILFGQHGVLAVFQEVHHTRSMFPDPVWTKARSLPGSVCAKSDGASLTMSFMVMV